MSSQDVAGSLLCHTLLLRIRSKMRPNRDSPRLLGSFISRGTRAFGWDNRTFLAVAIY